MAQLSLSSLVDYMSVAANLVFSATTSEVCTDIPIILDRVVEIPETFRVSLSSSDSAASLVRNTAIVNIVGSTRKLLR